MFLDLVNQNKKIDSFLAGERQFPPLDNLLTQHCTIMVGYYNKGEFFFYIILYNNAPRLSYVICGLLRYFLLLL